MDKKTLDKGVTLWHSAQAIKMHLELLHNCRSSTTTARLAMDRYKERAKSLPLPEDAANIVLDQLSIELKKIQEDLEEQFKIL